MYFFHFGTGKACLGRWNVVKYLQGLKPFKKGVYTMKKLCLLLVALVMLLLLACTAAVSFDGFDFATNFTAALSCISNVGPGLGLIGPSGNFAIFSPLSKLVMAFTMLFGRLEIFPMLLLFAPMAWRRNG